MPGSSNPFSGSEGAVTAGGTYDFPVPAGPTVTMRVPAQPSSGWTGLVGPVGVGVAVPKVASLGVDFLSRESLPPSPYATDAELAAGLKPMTGDFLSYFRALPGITTSSPVPITIDGLSGQVVTYTVGVLPDQAAQAACYAFDTQPCMILDASNGGATYVNQGDTGEEAVLDSPWGPLAVSWEAPASQKASLGPALASAMRAIKFRSSTATLS